MAFKTNMIARFTVAALALAAVTGVGLERSQHFDQSKTYHKDHENQQNRHLTEVEEREYSEVQFMHVKNDVRSRWQAMVDTIHAYEARQHGNVEEARIYEALSVNLLTYARNEEAAFGYNVRVRDEKIINRPRPGRRAAIQSTALQT